MATRTARRGGEGLGAAALFAVLLGGCALDWSRDWPGRDAGGPEVGLPDGAPDGKVSPSDGGGDLPADAGADAAIPDGPIADAPVPPANQTCKTAQFFLPTVGKATVIKGDTSLSADQFSALKCSLAGVGKLTTTLGGPQVYYRWVAGKGLWYKLTLNPIDTYLYLYTFTGGACGAKDISDDCQSGGSEGTAVGVWDGDTAAIYHKAASNGDAYFAVDSPQHGGRFVATVKKINPPANAKCFDATPISFSGAKVTVSGDTGPNLTPDEFNTLECGTSTLPLKGPQVYYSVDLAAGASYRLTLEAISAINIYAYIFAGGCTEAAIQSDCKSGGKTGAVTSIVTTGGATTLVFKAAAKGTYKIAVDSKSPGSFGGFTLTVEKL